MVTSFTSRFTLAVVALILGSRYAVAEIEDTGIQLQQTIPLSGVEGRIDHLDFDPVGGRLFVCALGNNSVEVLDLHKGERVHSISNLGAPQGLAYVPGLDRLFVASDNGGIVRIFDASSFQPVAQLSFKDDADNVRYDVAAKRIYVGFGNGGIGVINVADNTLVASIKLAAHPEAFVLEKKRIFVNLPTSRQIAVIDRDEGEVIATWSAGPTLGNFPIALDETDHRLLVGCRIPPKLVVLDTELGKAVASVGISGDPDDVFYDSKRHRIYVIGGAGKIDVIEQKNTDTYTTVAKIETGPGARTGLFVQALDLLFVAVPHRGNQVAEVRCYQIK